MKTAVRVLLTLVVLFSAGFLGYDVAAYYLYSPWTREAAFVRTSSPSRLMCQAMSPMYEFAAISLSKRETSFLSLIRTDTASPLPTRKGQSPLVWLNTKCCSNNTSVDQS